MRGRKTWLAAICTAGFGVVNIMDGDTEGGMQQIVLALGLVGVGHKIEKYGIMPSTHKVSYIANLMSRMKKGKPYDPVGQGK